MGKNKHDIQIGNRENPVGKFSKWVGILSIPSSVFLLGIPLGIIARYMGGKVIAQTKDDASVGQAMLGRYFGCAGIIISVVWGLVLVGMAIVGVIGGLLNAIFK